MNAMAPNPTSSPIRRFTVRPGTGDVIGNLPAPADSVVRPARRRGTPAPPVVAPSASDAQRDSSSKSSTASSVGPMTNATQLIRSRMEADSQSEIRTQPGGVKRWG
jgi:hypothetical protein